MTITYRTGYNGTRRTLEELKAWSRFAGVHPEVQRRVIALMDAARAAGTDLGIGGALRTTAEQTSLFLSRHYEVASGGCCGYNGKRYALRQGMAHAAPPGRSYHEPTIGDKCLALDMVGWENGWMEKNLAAYGMRSFATLVNNREEWHIQPSLEEIPTSRTQFNPTIHKLKVWPLPAAPAVTLNPYGAWPTTAKPTIREGYEGDVVRYLERVLVEKGGQVLAPDRYFRSDTTTAVKNLQRFFGLVVDGVVGSQTWPVIDMLAKK